MVKSGYFTHQQKPFNGLPGYRIEAYCHYAQFVKRVCSSALFYRKPHRLALWSRLGTVRTFILMTTLLSAVFIWWTGLWRASSLSLKYAPPLVIDLVSIGSLVRPEYLDAQESTMAQHRTVRHFFRITELNDTETNCHSHLSVETLKQLVGYCNRTTEYAYLNFLKRLYLVGSTKETGVDWIMRKSNPVGWLCAQKRPLDGLYAVLMQYRARQLGASDHTADNITSAARAPFPDYLIIMDDDTWINLDQLTSHAWQQYPSHLPFVTAGCLLRLYVPPHNFPFPYGGFSTIFTRAALHNMLRPIPDCFRNHSLSSSPSSPGDYDFEEDDDDGFLKNACWRLEQDNIGERQFFQPGMCVADLMYQYAAAQQFMDPAHWGSPGFCLHSDHALGYFINFYNVAVHSGEPLFLDQPDDRLRAFKGQYVAIGPGKYTRSLGAPWSKTECRYQPEQKCHLGATFCHYMTPRRMMQLYQEARWRYSPYSYS